MGQSKEQEKKRSSQAKRSIARRRRHRDRMLTIFRVHGSEAEGLGRKLRRVARAGQLN